tara:strand:+ start:1951 stop:3168 length:1218 start_codon:yes stop_codon:yes gene_type:complete
MKSIFAYLNQVGIIPLGLLCLYLINPFDKGFLAGYVLILFIYLKKDFLLQNIDSTYFLLTLFSLVYAAFYTFNMGQGVQWLFIYALFPGTFYLLGKKFVVSSSNIDSITLFYLFFILSIMYSLTGILSVGINLLKGGFVQVGRSIANFWTGKEKLATAMGAFFIFNMSVPGILIAAKNKLPIWMKIFAGGIFFISLLCVFRLGSRTQIVLIILSIVFALVYLLKSQNMVSNFKLALGVVVVIFLSINYLSIDLDADYLSSLGERLQDSDNAGSAGGRTGRWEKSIVNLFEKPLGWDVNEFGYSHNMWFDAARNGSVISFVLLLIFTIKATLNIKKALQAEPKAILFNSTVLIYSIAIFSQLFVEPALESLFILFVFFCFMQGVLIAYTQKVKEEKQQIQDQLAVE